MGFCLGGAFKAPMSSQSPLEHRKTEWLEIPGLGRGRSLVRDSSPIWHAARDDSPEWFGERDAGRGRMNQIPRYVVWEQIKACKKQLNKKEQPSPVPVLKAVGLTREQEQAFIRLDKATNLEDKVKCLETCFETLKADWIARP
eukprot:s3905_g3.t1